MKQLEDRHYMADNNKIFIRMSDSVKFGTEIYLALNDSIDNYNEVDMTDEDREYIESQKKEHNSMDEKLGNKHKIKR